VLAFPNLNFSTEHGEAQREVIDKLGTGGRIGLAIGVAGSGKTTLLKPLVHAWRHDGRTVHGIALAWRQSDDLADAGIEGGRAPWRHFSHRSHAAGSRSTRNRWL
jgi:molybdopterin-guanine dinucleotide biosynthesis protein